MSLNVNTQLWAKFSFFILGYGLSDSRIREGLLKIFNKTPSNSDCNPETMVWFKYHSKRSEKDAGMAYSMVLSRKLTGKMTKITKASVRIVTCHGWDSNQGPPDTSDKYSALEQFAWLWFSWQCSGL
jgi:hypothetical protein